MLIYFKHKISKSDCCLLHEFYVCNITTMVKHFKTSVVKKFPCQRYQDNAVSKLSRVITIHAAHVVCFPHKVSHPKTMRSS
jgi:hypothetical protein